MKSKKRKNENWARDAAVEAVRDCIAKETKMLRDDEYLEFLDIIGADIDGMEAAKKEELAAEEGGVS